MNLSARRLKSTAWIFLFVTVLAIATTYGPFVLASLGFPGTYADELATGADQIVNDFVRTNPALFNAARVDDTIRVIYSDGIMVDYTMKFPGSSSPVVLDKIVASDSTQGNRNDASAECHPGSPSYTSYDTGYWGGAVTPNDPNDPAAGVTVTGTWISTGTVYVQNHSSYFACA